MEPLSCDRCDQEAVWVHTLGDLYLCGGHHAELSPVAKGEWDQLGQESCV